MVQNSENKAQKYLKEFYKGENTFIRKIPDFKQTGSMIGGLPDYLVINNGYTVWYEIKYLTDKKKSFSINEFTEQQLQIFSKMSVSGANINILIYWGKEKVEIPWDMFLIWFVESNNKPIPKKLVMEGNR
jgi:penicillin-binding protein-related factor A (putative recombinase)